ncbi:hypothetical protein [Tateyamaria sp. Alg231-49]|uniref:hypothetical protein n=1 Tax=Tateyamaria sp. Alg231-49 TaxID=1922219 RepID=UPI000D55D61D|nr:hypothetical protein [Tateyamaria sp. Alg231-49]
MPTTEKTNDIKIINRIQKSNWEKLKKHIKRASANIKPEADLGTMYAGNFVGWDIIRDVEKILPAGEMNDLNLQPLYKVIQQANRREIRSTGKLRFDTIVDVLEDMRAPVLICPDYREKVKFRHLAECAFQAGKVVPVGTNKKASENGGLNGLLPTKHARILWDFLSTIYVGNAEGEIKILEGVSDDHTKLGRDKVMIRTELEKALKNSKLDEKTLQKLRYMVEKYADALSKKTDPATRRLEQLLVSMKKHAKPIKRAPKSY